jgi:hypothetical protein
LRGWRIGLPWLSGWASHYREPLHMPIPAGPTLHAHFAGAPADGNHYDVASDDTAVE